MTFSLLPGHGVVFVHLEAAIFLEIQIHSSLASSGLFCNESRYVKRRWGVTGFQRAVSGTAPSLDITLRGWNLTSFTSSLGPITHDHLKLRRHGCDSNLCNYSRKPFRRLDHSQLLYSSVHNTADVHSLDFAAHCIPFLSATPPSSQTMVSQRFHSPLYLYTHQYLLQCLSNTVSNGGRQTHRCSFID